MIYVTETFVNLTEGYRHETQAPYEAYTDDYGELYRVCVSEYGRCTGKVYRENKSGVYSCGWVFVKRAKYEDCADTFLQETWICLFTSEDGKTFTAGVK